MSSLEKTILAIQGFTFLALGALYVTGGKVKLGAAQLMLAVITWLVYA